MHNTVVQFQKSNLPVHARSVVKLALNFIEYLTNR